MAGLTIDVGWFVISAILHHPSPSRELALAALAALAESLIIIGGSLVLFGVVGRWATRVGAFRRRPVVPVITVSMPVVVVLSNRFSRPTSTRAT